MKLYAFLLICCACYYVDAQLCIGEHLKIVFAKCMEEEEAKPADIEDILSQKSAANENAKCLRACLMQECNGMDATGNINPIAYKDYLEVLSPGNNANQLIIDTVFEKCYKSVKNDGKVCSTAENYFQCIFTECKDCGFDLHNI